MWTYLYESGLSPTKTTKIIDVNVNKVITIRWKNENDKCSQLTEIKLLKSTQTSISAFIFSSVLLMYDNYHIRISVLLFLQRRNEGETSDTTLTHTLNEYEHINIRVKIPSKITFQYLIFGDLKYFPSCSLCLSSSCL